MYDSEKKGAAPPNENCDDEVAGVESVQEK